MFIPVPKLIETLGGGYSSRTLAGDLVAGVTVGLVALPLAMAFAIASGLPPQNGLYCAVIAGFIMPHTPDAVNHLVAAVCTWLAYVSLWITRVTRGLTGRRFSLCAVVLFILSLAVFALL